MSRWGEKGSTSLLGQTDNRLWVTQSSKINFLRFRRFCLFRPLSIYFSSTSKSKRENSYLPETSSTTTAAANGPSTKHIKPNPTLLTTAVVLEQMARVDEDVFDAARVAAQIPSLAEINRDSAVADALNIDRRIIRFHGLTRVDSDMPLVDQRQTKIPTKINKHRSTPFGVSSASTPSHSSASHPEAMTRTETNKQVAYREEQCPSSMDPGHLITEGFVL